MSGVEPPRLLAVAQSDQVKLMSRGEGTEERFELLSSKPNLRLNAGAQVQVKWNEENGREEGSEADKRDRIADRHKRMKRSFGEEALTLGPDQGTLNKFDGVKEQSADKQTGAREEGKDHVTLALSRDFTQEASKAVILELP